MPELAVIFAQQIVENAKQEILKHEQYLRELMNILIVHYFDLVWEPIFGKSFLSEGFFEYWHMKRLLNEEHFNYRQSCLFSQENKYNDILDWCEKYKPLAPQRLIDRAVLFDDKEKNTVKWHPLTLQLIDKFASEDFLSILSSNLATMGAVGSMVPVLKKRLELAQMLSNHSNPMIKQWADRVADHYENRIKHETLWDDEESLRK